MVDLHQMGSWVRAIGRENRATLKHLYLYDYSIRLVSGVIDVVKEDITVKTKTLEGEVAEKLDKASDAFNWCKALHLTFG